MTPFKVEWDIDAAPLLAGHPDVNLERIQALYFDAAAAQWSHVVRGWPSKAGNPDAPLDLPGGGAFTHLAIRVVFKELPPAQAEDVARVDTAELRDYLAQGPNGEQFPTRGTITIDLRDMERLLDDQPRFKDTIVHEIGHVLGLGTIFDLAGLVTKSGDGYRGRFGSEAYAQLLGEPAGSRENVPLQKEIANSTPAFHWDERALEKDIMSTLLDQPGAAGSSRRRANDSPATRINVISTVTAGALLDLGYLVDATQAMKTRAARVPPPATD